VKQCRVMVSYAKLIARGDAEYGQASGFSEADLRE
jgi:hypothetical protein